MSWGQQWLNDWEAEKDDDVETPVPVPRPVKPAPDLDRLRRVVTGEVSRYLTPTLARDVADRVVDRVRALSDGPVLARSKQ